MAEPEPTPFNWIFRPVYEVPFNGAVAANTQLTLVSNMLPYNFRIIGVNIRFDTDHNDNVRHYVLCAHNRTTSTTGPPADENVFSRYSPTPYWTGHALFRRIRTNFKYEGARNYIKVHVNNTNAYAINIDVSILVKRES